jgi:transposase-like protein
VTIQALLPVVRWTPAHKAEVLWALARKLITIEQACAVHGLTPEEIESWQRLARKNGALGLRTTKLQEYRGGRGQKEQCRQSPAIVSAATDQIRA